jgi:hypothetical protein
LSNRTDSGTPPKKAKAETWPSQNASVVSAGYALMKNASECRQRHREVVQLAAHPADLAERLAEVHLGVPGRMRQGHEHLLGPAFLLPNIVGDNRDPAGEAVLVPQPFEDPLRCVPLLRIPPAWAV